MTALTKDFCFRYENVAPGSAYHAALVAVEAKRARGFHITEHTHDFYELMFTLAGEAIHIVNGQAGPLTQGDLIFLRPGDRHAIRFQTGRLLQYINIAVPRDVWRDFSVSAGLHLSLEQPDCPPTVALNEFAAAECAGAFRRALLRFQSARNFPAGLRLEACRLLAISTPNLLPEGPNSDNDPDSLPAGAPPWLTRACRLMRHDGEAVREGLPGFIAAAGVTRTHLARVLKKATGQTPTEYVNELRLQRAALLLTTTTLPILDIAGECGFEQASYFYRLFHARYGSSPRAYRTGAWRSVSPD